MKCRSVKSFAGLLRYWPVSRQERERGGRVREIKHFLRHVLQEVSHNRIILTLWKWFFHVMTVYWPAVQQPGSEAERCWGCAAAGGLRFAASDAAVELHTSAAGTVLLCWAVCVTPAGIPAHRNRHRKSGLSLHKIKSGQSTNSQKFRDSVTLTNNHMWHV